MIFSFVLNRYFLKPIKSLVTYTKIIKEKSRKKTNINELKNRNDELGLLSKSLDDMTIELQKRVAHAENFSTDLVHEIRNPLASLKSASEILQDTNSSEQRLKLLNILSHDVLRIERLITDYSQMLKDEVALSKEKMKKINIEPIIQSVVDDYYNIQKVKKNIKENKITGTLEDWYRVEDHVFRLNAFMHRIEMGDTYDEAALFARKQFIDYDNQAIKIENLNLALGDIKKVYLIACGTAYYSCLLAKYYFEQYAAISVECDMASEFRYRKNRFKNDNLYIFVLSLVKQQTLMQL